MVWVSLYCSGGFLNGLDITGCHLLDTQQLESSINELWLKFVKIPGPSTFGSYNVHNVLAGSNIYLFGCVLSDWRFS